MPVAVRLKVSATTRPPPKSGIQRSACKHFKEVDHFRPINSNKSSSTPSLPNIIALRRLSFGIFSNIVLLASMAVHPISNTFSRVYSRRTKRIQIEESSDCHLWTRDMIFGNPLDSLHLAMNK
uniref:Uncharacterized protein n=1 Tax=Glossina austeni TaxID=7395 RepID=A0A1A9UL12_GLOAU